MTLHFLKGQVIIMQVYLLLHIAINTFKELLIAILNLSLVGMVPLRIWATLGTVTDLFQFPKG
jgi:hypothetical protein